MTPELEAEVLTLHQRQIGDLEDIARETGLSKSTVKYILGGRWGTTNSSLRANILTALDGGPVANILELRERIGNHRNAPLHDITHVLHNLHTAGRLDFDERGSRDHLTNIHLRPKQPKKTVVDEAEQQEPGGAPAVASPEPEPTPEGYPLLDELLEREKSRLDGDSKGMAFVVAAEAIERIDPDTARELMAKAKRYDVPYPSPVEAEYLRYVKDHGATE